MRVLVAQSCTTLCDPIDCSLLGSSVHGILQARILEWVAISHSKIREALQNDTFKISSQLKEAPTYQSFSPVQLASNASRCRTVGVEFFSSLSCSCERLSLNDGSQLVIVNV